MIEMYFMGPLQLLVVKISQESLGNLGLNIIGMELVWETRDYSFIVSSRNFFGLSGTVYCTFGVILLHFLKAIASPSIHLDVSLCFNIEAVVESLYIVLLIKLDWELFINFTKAFVSSDVFNKRLHFTQCPKQIVKESL
jgi:hypothetical protein